MATVILVTTVDPSRPGLAYKVEVPDWAMEEWHDENLILKSERRENWVREHKRTGNTVITVISSDGSMITNPYRLTWDQINDLLKKADYEFEPYAEEGRRPGRPEKKVLVMTTSKERRQGSQVARSAY